MQDSARQECQCIQHGGPHGISCTLVVRRKIRCAEPPPLDCVSRRLHHIGHQSEWLSQKGLIRCEGGQALV